MDINQIKDLMNQLESSRLKKIVYKKGNFELHLEKESVGSSLPKSKTGVTDADLAFQSEVSLKAERSAVLCDASRRTYDVTSPMVGTFYNSPAPDQPCFVKVGDKVDENTVVCIVEAMKVMNEVKAGISGTVVEILVENAQPIEFGTPLLRIV